MIIENLQHIANVVTNSHQKTQAEEIDSDIVARANDSAIKRLINSKGRHE